MLVLVSFVLVLAAAVTLVVGLLQSGLTLIYLSIGCSVLAGVVLAVAVLRGRPEPRPAAAPRSFTPPARAQATQVPASVGAPSSVETTTSWTPPPPPPAATPTPPPPPPPSAPRDSTDDAATRAAGTALLGRLRGRRAQQDETPEAAAPVAVPAAEPEDEDEFEPVSAGAASDATAEMAAVPSTAVGSDGAFPIADYERLRATELLARLPDLDRDELEAVREREAAGKNRFTIMSRIDALLAQESPAWDVPEDDWEAEPATGVVVESEAVEVEEDFAAPLDEAEFAAAGTMEDDEVDELVSPAADFPIPAYETLTVGQILPRLSELDADDLAQVRAREQQGRARGTILDRIDRLAAKAGTGAGAMAMPPAAAPARKTGARKTTARTTPAPAKAAEPVTKKRGRATKAADAPIAMPAAPAPAPKKAATRKAAAPTAKAAPAKKAAVRGKVITPAEPAAIKQAVKKARATKKAKKA